MFNPRFGRWNTSSRSLDFNLQHLRELRRKRAVQLYMIEQEPLRINILVSKRATKRVGSNLHLNFNRFQYSIFHTCIHILTLDIDHHSTNVNVSRQVSSGPSGSPSSGSPPGRIPQNTRLSWWLQPPIWKKYARHIGSFHQVRVKINKYLEPTPIDKCL